MLKPLSDRIVISTASTEQVSAGGIVLPDTAKEKPLQGKVVAVGEGAQMSSGKIIPVNVKVGDTVVYGKYAGTEVKVDGEDYVIVRADDILAVIE